jgi:serine-type D-Ala-D-Ala carboxypeptidase/endopeptidase (penicillin-binding protein 4)
MHRKMARVTARLLLLSLGFAGLDSLAKEHRKQGPNTTDTRTKSAVAAAGFAARADRAAGVSPVNKGEWGILIADAATGETLYERNADSYFVPASNMKLLTTALALDTLGPEYRFRTTIESNGKLKKGVLRGDLILVGRGDANLSNRKFPFDTKEEFDGPPERALSELADQVVAHGVREIVGDIVGDDSYFPRERYPDGWEIDDMVWEYGAAISAIVVNDNTVTLTLTPEEKVGSTVLASVEPATPEFVVRNEVKTIGAKEKGELRLTREPGAASVVVSGTMAAGGQPRKLLLAIQEPAQHAATLLAKQLALRGVKLRGQIRAKHEPDTAGSVSRSVLAEHLSLPLGDTVKLVNKISQNLHTEILLRASARQQGLWQTPEDLTKFPEAFYTKAGITAGDVIQTDGSGLSRHDMVTPRAFVTLLQYAQKQSWFPAYYVSLPVAGVDGTLTERMKNAGITGKIHAKTGSVTHVRALSGYAETTHGRKLVFSFLSNNQGGSGKEIHEAIDGLCMAMIEEFDAPETDGKNYYRVWQFAPARK